MWFKNLLIYRLHSTGFSPDKLEKALSDNPLVECSGMQMQSRGWVAPRKDDSRFVYSIGKHLLICLGVEKKILPGSVIKQATMERALEIEQQQGYKPGRKQLKEIKELIIDELLPRAFINRRQTYAWLDLSGGWLFIDASSGAKGDEIIEMLNKSFDEGLEITFLNTKMSPESQMTSWLANQDGPENFSIDRECELHCPNDSKSVVRFKNHSLDNEEMQKHLRAHKQASKLALTWRDKISFVLESNLQLKRVAPLDMLKEEAESEDQFDGDFIMMTGEIPHLLGDLILALGGEEG